MGLCTYASPEGQLATVATKFLPAPEVKVEANPTHYGDPAGGCESDEQAVQVQGLSGDFCCPKSASGSCPSDVPTGAPTGVTAKSTCAVRSPTEVSNGYSLHVPLWAR